MILKILWWHGHIVTVIVAFLILVRTLLHCYNMPVPIHATLAQLVEHLIRNEKVAGSIPAGGSKHKTRRVYRPRVSYNGYYMTFPRLRQGFDSPHPHHFLAGIAF